MYAAMTRGGDNKTTKFHDYPNHVTDEMLSQHYSDRFRLFQSETEAREFAETQQHAYVSRITDYRQSDVEKRWEYNIKDGVASKRFAGFNIRPGATKHTKGWLVSLVSLRLLGAS